MKYDALLLIETASHACSAAMVDTEGYIMAEEYVENAHAAHASLIGTMVRQVIQKSDCHPSAVGVSAGPGSYTGLRIGSSIAKGLCFGYGIPLVSVSTLHLMSAMAQKMTDATNDIDLFCPMLDARRMEVYTALYDREGTAVITDHPKIIDENSFAEHLATQHILFFGNGVAKCRALLEQHPHAHFLPEFTEPCATALADLVRRKLAASQIEDTAYWEPNYLKEFHAEVAQNKVLSSVISHS